MTRYSKSWWAVATRRRGEAQTVRARIRLMLVPLAFLLLGGCGMMPGAGGGREPATEYALEWNAKSAKPESTGCPVLVVSPPHAAAGYTGARMVYVKVPHELEAYVDHRWVDTPARMLEPLLVRAVEQSGVCRIVVPAGSGMHEQLRLDTEILMLRQNFIEGRNDLQFELRVTLLDMQRHAVIATQTLSAVEPAAEVGPYAGVRAANRALDRILNDLMGFLRAHVDR